MAKKYFILFFLFSALKLAAIECVSPLCVVGSGFCNADHRHSHGILQVEYRWGKRYIFCSRPQAVLLAPSMKALFVGLGVGLELYTNRHILVIPSFTPGLYYRGSGKDLGFPLEFRSAIEAAYEWDCGWRFGVQAYHISNASLGRHNPGTNTFLFNLAIPIKMVKQ